MKKYNIRSKGDMRLSMLDLIISVLMSHEKELNSLIGELETITYNMNQIIDRLEKIEKMGNCVCD